MAGALVSSTCGLESCRKGLTQAGVAVVCQWSVICPAAALGRPKMEGRLTAGRSGVSLLLHCLLNTAWQWGENRAEENSGRRSGPSDVPLPQPPPAWLENEGL